MLMLPSLACLIISWALSFRDYMKSPNKTAIRNYRLHCTWLELASMLGRDGSFLLRFSFCSGCFFASYKEMQILKFKHSNFEGSNLMLNTHTVKYQKELSSY